MKEKRMRQKIWIFLIGVTGAWGAWEGGLAEEPPKVEQWKQLKWNVKISLVPLKTQYLVAEPLGVRIEWKNESPYNFVYGEPHPRVQILLVSVDGGAARKFRNPDGLCRRAPGRHEGEDKIEPGERFWETAFVVKGFYSEAKIDRRSPLAPEFLFSTPGKYRICVGPSEEEALIIDADKDGFVVEVTMPTSEVDKEALRLWKEQGAEEFKQIHKVHMIEPPRRLIKPEEIKLEGLRTLVAKFPESVYAEYARWALARLLAATFRKEAGKEAQAHLDYLFQKSKNLAIVESVIALKARYAQSPEDLWPLRERLREVCPQSPLLEDFTKKEKELAMWKSMEELQKKATAKPPVVRGPLPLTLKEGPLSQLPEPAAATMKKYWKAIADRDLEAVLGCLSEKFMGNKGTKENKRRMLERRIKTEEADEFRIEVQHVQRTGSYHRPASFPAGKQMDFQGDLALVEVKIFGRRKQTEGHSRVTWVLEAQPDGTWLIVSEYTHPDAEAKEPGSSPGKKPTDQKGAESEPSQRGPGQTRGAQPAEKERGPQGGPQSQQNSSARTKTFAATGLFGLPLGPDDLAEGADMPTPSAPAGTVLLRWLLAVLVVLSLGGLVGWIAVRRKNNRLSRKKDYGV